MALEQAAEAGCWRINLRVERNRRRLLRQAQAVIGEHHHVAVRLMFEVIVDAFLFAKPLQKGQIGFFVLNAERARRVVADSHLDPIAVGGQVMFADQLFKDGGHVQLREDPANRVLLQRLQMRHQHQLVGDPVCCAVFAAGTLNDAVNSVVIIQVQKCRLMQQCAGGPGGRQAHDFDLEPIGLIQRFMTAEAQDRQVYPALGQGQRKRTFLVIEHSSGLCSGDTGHRGYENTTLNGRGKPVFQNRPTRRVEDVDAHRNFWSIADFRPYKLGAMRRPIDVSAPQIKRVSNGRTVEG